MLGGTEGPLPSPRRTNRELSSLRKNQRFFKRKRIESKPGTSDYLIGHRILLAPHCPSSAFFPSRAAQKLNLSSKKKKHRPSLSSVAEPPLFATSFSGILQTCPPPAPPCLLRAVNKVKDTPGLGKVGAGRAGRAAGGIRAQSPAGRLTPEGDGENRRRI